MRFVTLARLPLLVAALLLPTAALAQFELPIDPDRLNGEGFQFFDNQEGSNNVLEVDVDGPSIAARGSVAENVGGDVVTITWEMLFPNESSANDSTADVSQDTQVLIGVLVDFAENDDYFGQAAPSDCSAEAKIRDTNGGVDDPDNAKASVSCDLGQDLEEFDDDASPATPGDPPEAALDLIDEAFSSRNDVKISVNKGKLSIKFNGGAPS